MKTKTAINHIISFSGGKDSTALVLWAKENLSEFITVYCDTKWESPITYEYIRYINDELLDGKLITVLSDKYDGFEDLSVKKKRVPSPMARFCTEELKIKPMRYFVSQFEEKIVYTGIRAEESRRRATMSDRGYDETYGCEQMRPLFYWTHQQVFDILRKHNIEPNPLYKMGMSRVGCFPCIMNRQPDLKQIFTRYPDVIERIRKLEDSIGRSFFSANAIPQYACSGYDAGSNRRYPLIDDVVRWVTRDGAELQYEGADDCMSYYALCGV